MTITLRAHPAHPMSSTAESATDRQGSFSSMSRE
jgi:hypothetical protein